MSPILQRFGPLFNPKSIVWIGASNNPEKWGYSMLFQLLRGGYKGKVYPVNPNGEEILGLDVYPKVTSIPEAADLAVVLVSPSVIPKIIAECVQKGVKSGIIISAGFAELGAEGKRLEEETVEIARRGGMVLVGPNCNGVISTTSNLYVRTLEQFPKPGNLAVVTQSGNVGSSLTRRALRNDVGLSRYVSSGNEADLHCQDFIEFLGEDNETKVILAYMEGFRNGREFFGVFRRVAQRKPIVVLKGGNTDAGTKAAQSHTAALTAPEPIFDALCKQTGAIKVRDEDELFNLGVAFLTQPLPKGRGVGIITTAGGWGVLAADACAKRGLDVIPLPEEAFKKINQVLASRWSQGNPVDTAGAPKYEELRICIEALLECSNIDSLLLLGFGVSTVMAHAHLSSQSEEDNRLNLAAELMADDQEIVNDLKKLINQYGKPIILSSPWFPGVTELEKELAMNMGKNGILCCSLPEHAVAVLSGLVQYSEYLKAT